MNLFQRNTQIDKNRPQENRSIFQKRDTGSREITSDMTPEEISEIVSEQMIEIVRKQFREFDEKKK